MPARFMFRIRSSRPSIDLETAFLGDFPPGQYTAIISGKNCGTGVLSVINV
jgi:hypothetical protein